MSFRVAILSPAFNELNPGYSLTGIVLDQIEMLKKYGNEVELWVSENFNDPRRPNVPIKKIIPHSDLIDYRSEEQFIPEHKFKREEDGGVVRDDENGDMIANPITGEFISDPNHPLIASRTSDVLCENLKDIDIVFTHDWVFTGWNLPYFMGLRDASKRKAVQHVRWLHWVHSLPNHGFDWWDIDRLGGAHKIISPSRCYQQRYAEAFRGFKRNVRHIPHIKDIRKLCRFVPETLEFLDANPHIMNTDVVQIYPVGSDRLGPKRVREVILILKEIKKLGFSVCLVLANQWATGKQPKENIHEYKELAFRNGLSPFKEVIFTSEFKPEYEVGISHEMVADLFHISNLFIFPTVSESFGLVLPEAILCGGVLPVVNNDLEVSTEITAERGLRFSFGSFNRNVDHPNEADYFRAVANVIIERMMDEEAVASRTHIRQTYNLDTVYKKYYNPIMTEAMTAWI